MSCYAYGWIQITCVLISFCFFFSRKMNIRGGRGLVVLRIRHEARRVFASGGGGDRGVAQLFGAPRAEQLVPGLGRCPRSQPTNHNSQTVRHASFRLTDLEALAQVSNEACVRGSPRCIGACQDRRSDRQSRSNGQFVATCH